MNPLLAGRRFSVADEEPDISASHCIKPRRGKKKKALLAVSVSHILGRPPSKPSLSSSCSTLWECLLSSTQRWMALQHSESLWELSFLQTDINAMIWTQHCFFFCFFVKLLCVALEDCANLIYLLSFCSLIHPGSLKVMSVGLMPWRWVFRFCSSALWKLWLLPTKI